MKPRDDSNSPTSAVGARRAMNFGAARVTAGRTYQEQQLDSPLRLVVSHEDRRSIKQGGHTLQVTDREPYLFQHPAAENDSASPD